MLGFSAGGYYDQPGDGVDYECMPRDPIYHTYFELDHMGRIYGAEYQDYHTKNLHDQDVPCAVCRTTHSTVLMIPGRDTCYPGWTKQFHGMLASGDAAHPSASQYVCLDASPEVVPGGQNNLDGKLFYLVESICGSLPCPPYKNGQVLTCVVCSK